MCGVFGILLRNPKAVPDEARLLASMRVLHHRGPDAQLIHQGPGVGFAHTRLSFLDVDARSNQPFWDPTGRYALIYNGEIYNYQKLRAELAAEGVEFRTSSDTEVLLHWLLNRPTDVALRALEGMFAFALYDAKARTLLLARDRFGMKPMFVTETQEGFLFASEAKAFRPWVDLAADPLMVASYLLNFRGPTSGFTFLKGVSAVRPGQYLTLKPGETPKAETFARLEDFLDAGKIHSLAGATPRQMADDLDELMTQAVKSHMFADVPVGAFCSGGVDSSLLMAMAARTHDNLAIFHANVKGRWSEYGSAAALSKWLGLDLKSVDVEEQDFIDGLPEAVAHFEQPFADRPNCVPMMRVAQLARDSGVKGLLSGEGSDECFLGYPWLGRRKLTDAYYRTGDRLRSAVRSIPGLGEVIWPKLDNNGDVVRAMLNRREVDDDNARIRQAVRDVGAGRPMDHHEWTLEYLHHHLRILLHRNDTMGMTGSVESRFPFLDHGVVSRAVNLPGQFKLRTDLRVLDKAHPFVRDKWVVREVADRYMPAHLSRRNKFGFWTTVFQRFQISPAYFKGSYVSEFLELTPRQLDDVLASSPKAMALRLLHLDLWGRICVRGEPQAESLSRLRDTVSIGAETSGGAPR